MIENFSHLVKQISLNNKSNANATYKANKKKMSQ